MIYLRFILLKEEFVFFFCFFLMEMSLRTIQYETAGVILMIYACACYAWYAYFRGCMWPRDEGGRQKAVCLSFCSESIFFLVVVTCRFAA